MNGIEIISKESVQAGRCYSKTNYQIISSKPIDYAMLSSLINLGFISNGQERSIHQVIDGKRQLVPDEMTWNNKPTHSVMEQIEQDGFIKYNFSWIYEVTIGCDSGD